MASQIKTPTSGNTTRSANTQATKVTTFVNQQLEKTRRQVKSTDLMGGLLTVLALALSFLLLAAIWDAWISPLSPAGRWVCLAVLIGGCALYAAFAILPLLVRKINPDYAAKMIEDAKPSFKNSLLNYVSLRKKTEIINPAVFDAVSRQAATDLSSVPADATVDRSKLIRLGFILIGLTMFGVGYKMLSPKDPLQTFGRILAPSAKLAQPAVVRISEVHPGDTQVFFGETLEVTAVIRGSHQPSDVHIDFSTNDGQLTNQRIAMLPSGVTGRYRGDLAVGGTGIQQSLTYRVVALDGISPDFDVVVQANPTIAVESLVITPPAYTKMAERTLVGQGNVETIEASQITVHAVANLPIQTATIELLQIADSTSDPGSAVPRVVRAIEMLAEGKSASGRFAALLNSSRQRQIATHYRLTFLTTDGDRNLKPNVYPIKIIPDLAPEISITQPNIRDVSVAENGTLAIDIEARDLDFEISNVQLQLDHQGAKLLNKNLELKSTNGNQHVTARYLLKPNELRLRAGDKAIFFATAADNRTAPENQAQLDPNISRSENFTLTITEAEKQPASQQPSQSGKSDEGEPKPEDNGGESKSGEGDKEDTSGDEGSNPSESGEEKSGEPQKGDSGDSNSKEGASGDSQSGDSQSGDSQSGDSQSGQSQSGQSESEGSQTGQGDQSSGATGPQNEPGAGESGKSESPDPNKAGDQNGTGNGSQESPQEGSQSQDQSASGSETGSGSESSTGGGGESGTGTDAEANGDPNGQSPNAGSGMTEKGTGENSGSQTGSGGGNKSESDSDNSSSGPGRKDDSLTEGQRQPLDKNASTGEQIRRLQDVLHDQQENGEGSAAQRNPNGQPADVQNGGSPENGGNPSQTEQQSPNEQGSGQQNSGQQGSGQPNAGQQNSGGQGNGAGQQQADPRNPNKQNGPGESGSNEANESPGDGTRPDQGTQRQNPGSPSGQSTDEQNKSNSSQNGSDQENPSESSSSQQDSSDQSQSGQSQSGESPSGQSQPGESQSSQSQSDQSQSGESQSGQSQSGQSQSGQSQSGQSQSGQSQSGQSQSGQSQSGQSQSDQSQPGQSQPGQSQSGQSQPGSAAGQTGESSSETTGENTPQFSGGTGSGGGKLASEQIEREELNLEHSKKATDLILKKLDDQKYAPDPKLLEEMNWTQDDLNNFLQRWKEMKAAAGNGDPRAQRTYERTLKSLDLRANAERRTVRQNDDKVENLSTDNVVIQPPPDLAPEFNATLRDLNRQ